MTMKGRTQAQTTEVQLLQKTYSIPRSFNFRQRYPATTRMTGKHSKNASTPKRQAGEAISGTCRLLQKICTMLLRHS